MSERRLTKRKEAHTGNSSTDNGDKYLSHAELCIRQHLTLEMKAASIKSRYKSQPQPADADTEKPANDLKMSSSNPDSYPTVMDDQSEMVESPVDTKDSNSMNIGTPEETASAIAEEEALKELDQLLVKRVLQLAVELETQARILLMHTMPKGSRAEILLRADLVRLVNLWFASILTSTICRPYSGFSSGKFGNCIWKTRIENCYPMGSLTSMSQRVGILISMSASGDIGSFLLRCWLRKYTSSVSHD